MDASAGNRYAKQPLWQSTSFTSMGRRSRATGAAPDLSDQASAVLRSRTGKPEGLVALRDHRFESCCKHQGAEPKGSAHFADNRGARSSVSEGEQNMGMICSAPPFACGNPCTLFLNPGLQVNPRSCNRGHCLFSPCVSCFQRGMRCDEKTERDPGPQPGR